MEVERKIKEFAPIPLQRHVLMEALHEYHYPNNKIADLVKEGKLRHIRRGIYIADPSLDVNTPEPFLLANHIYGPSYVSQHSALSYYGMIPERVFAITSITTKASRSFETIQGNFYYRQLPLPYYAFGISILQLSEKQFAMVATPEKALFDTIVTTAGILLRSRKQVQEYLIENMRMDEEMLGNLNLEEMETWVAEAPKSSSLQMVLSYLKTLQPAS